MSLLRDVVWIYVIFAATWQTLDFFDWVRRALRLRQVRRILRSPRRPGP